ncbi:hypothetical protein [Mesorhizobium sp. WSM3626]|uniref:hypothetical protein n=1 Tax=Mesorhizobium sp. WSM3626 TaxID=1040987 RepID=UPI0004833598|nr:hypothetical protein [Mesorhizobium sp. WSM3626]
MVKSTARAARDHHKQIGAALFISTDGRKASLRTEPWGSRTFIVGDPDGNLIAFASSATSG